MKNLFILVSILALSYLALQTSIAKNLLSGISNPFESGLANAHLDNHQIENNAAKANEKLIASISELASRSVLDKQVFTQRLNELEKNVAVLTDTLQSNIVEPPSTPLAVHATEQQAADSHANEEVVTSHTQGSENTVLASIAEPEQNLVSKSSEQINQQQKRIQQQAVLRALSHKMELAALSNLVN